MHTENELKTFDAGDLRSLTQYRCQRVREELARRDCAGIVLFDPIHIRYATGSSNMQVWTTHNPVRYALVLTTGPTVMFEFPGAAHLLNLPGVMVDEIRRPEIFMYLIVGERACACSRSWASEIAALVKAHSGSNKRLAVDRVAPAGAFALAAEGLEVEDGEAVMECARQIKSRQEIELIRHSIRVAEDGMRAMRAVLSPGISEQQLWSHLHQSAIAGGAEWFETRLLTSGPKTAPWYQECGDRVIQSGDVISFDTDMIGPFGYCADISRSWLCGDRKPTDAQRRLYVAAYEILQRNLSLLTPDLGFAEYAQVCGDLPEIYRNRRYTVVAHGVGMADEYPLIPYPCDVANAPLKGQFRENMVICVECYLSRNDGSEGIKLEEQVALTDSGIEKLSTFPFEEAWL